MASKRSRAAFEDEQHHAPYAVYGTPLPPLDPEVRDDGSYVPVWKQEVRDDRGRKRLHGAFTGGFSAGYFNTVGSKEGWTPSTFVSSRRDRGKDGKRPVQQQRPEDFMDEEDLREAEEARVLQTVGDYAGFGSTAADATRLGGLMDILKTSGETMGVKLLKRMGWKEGQGIGPKVRRKANLGDGGVGDGEFHLFAPKNPPMISFIRKTDYKGLGFQAEARLDSNISPESGIKPRALGQGGDSDGFNGHRLSMNGKSSQNQNQPKWGGFGILVPNGAGLDEEEDPYSMGPQISYNRFIDQDKKNKKIPYNTAIPRQSIGLANPLLSSKPMFISKKRAAAEKAKEKPKLGFRKCHDGRLPLDGFLHGVEIAGLTISSDEKRYAPPEVPKDWKSTKTPSTSGPTPNYVSSAEAAKASSLDPSSRAALLGEAQLPGKSIFDYMTPAGREKIAKATGRKDLPPALGEKGPKGFEVSEEQKQKNLWDLLPKLDKEVAIQALNRGASGWMPYAEDEAKRSRYRSFLEVRAGLRHKLPDRAPDASTDDWLTELREFARAAQVFKPISGLMASRFTSSTASQPKATSDAPESPDEPLLRKPESKPQDPAEAAAKMGMYGPMTRSTVQFYPSRVLCKRFNVRPSANVTMDPGDSSGGQASGKDPTTSASGSKLDILSKEAVNRILAEAGGGNGALFQPAMEQEVEQQPPPPQSEKTEIVVDPERNETLEKERLERERVERIGIGVDPERNEALEGERPGAAVFKAIFGSDDEEEEGDEMVD